MTIDSITVSTCWITRRDYQKAERLRAVLTKPVFTANDVATALNYKSKMGASHLLGALVTAELVTQRSKASGSKPASYEWSCELDWDVLPTKQELIDAKK